MDSPLEIRAVAIVEHGFSPDAPIPHTGAGPVSTATVGCRRGARSGAALEHPARRGCRYQSNDRHDRVSLDAHRHGHNGFYVFNSSVVSGSIHVEEGYLAVSVSLETRYIEAGLFDATLIGPGQAGYTVNRLDRIGLRMEL